MHVSGVDVMDDNNAGDEDAANASGNPRAAAEPENAPAVASAASGGVEAQEPLQVAHKVAHKYQLQSPI